MNFCRLCGAREPDDACRPVKADPDEIFDTGTRAPLLPAKLVGQP
jgi:hypothetical protein